MFYLLDGGSAGGTSDSGAIPLGNALRGKGTYLTYNGTSGGGPNFNMAGGGGGAYNMGIPGYGGDGK